MSAHRILVVDDNVDAAESLKLLLECWGESVEIAHDGATALSIAEQQRPAIVLLDLGLPGMDGYQIAERLRQQANGTPPRLIAVTGYGRDEDRERTRAAGFDRHLLKPLDLERLRKLLESM